MRNESRDLNVPITVEEQKPELQDAIERLTTQVEAQNKLLREFVESQTHFGKRLVAGLWTGLGTVLGATVVVSLLIVVLKPLAEVDWVGPIVNRVIDSLDRRRPAIEPPPVQKQELKQVPVQNP
jgi:hypothetical protein